MRFVIPAFRIQDPSEVVLLLAATNEDTVLALGGLIGTSVSEG